MGTAAIAYDRHQVQDVMYRLAIGLDHDDPDALASAFTESATADFSPAAAKVGLEFPVVTRPRRDRRRVPD